MGKSRSYQGGRGRGVCVVGGARGRRRETLRISTGYVCRRPNLPDQLADNRIAVVEEAPSVMTVEQQQAEQMKVYWRVCVGSRFSFSNPRLTKPFAVHRGDVDELGITSFRSHSNHASDRSWLRQDRGATRGVYGGGSPRGPGYSPRRTLEAQQMSAIAVLSKLTPVALSVFIIERLDFVGLKPNASTTNCSVCAQCIQYS